MLPTVRDLLGLDVIRRGSPQVVAGADGLGARVRWVHVLELADAAHLLQGGELVLTTGVALPAEPALLARYAADLAAAGGTGVSALAVELGRRFVGALPAALVRAAADSGLTLIAFEREVPFVEITEAVHARIIDAQLEELRASERLHEVFTELSVSGASLDEVVRQAAILAGRPVILADLSHRVLACEPGSADPARLLAGFARRSRALVSPPGRTAYDEASGWLFTPVGARGEDWGRVILVCDGPPGGADTVLIERAATTLALGRLLTRHAESLDRQAHRTLIMGIISQAHADPAEAAVRSRALGVPVDGRQLIAVVFRLRDPAGHGGPLGVSAHARVLDVADAAAAACRAERVPSLVGTLDDARAGAMLSLSPRADPDRVLHGLTARIAERGGGFRGSQGAHGSSSGWGDLVIGVGAAAGSIRDVRRSFLEASQVADFAAERPGERFPGRRERPAFYRLADLRLRGLLHLLRDDPRMQTFVERELGPLLAAEPDTSLLDVLAAYLAAGGNKAEAAKRAHLARPTFYERLRRIERLLGTDLGSAESRTSLHVAMLALEAAGRADTGYVALRTPTEGAAVQ
ncbi:MAG TPA: PucR family transcriptional regulator ligand-binding domain-containing protein [Streptosporangiaceae bacterium]|nr:PucR family transcriptional regulator ligand-binding domain-containing protein [Streptosporangiaceae bacterium]